MQSVLCNIEIAQSHTISGLLLQCVGTMAVGCVPRLLCDFGS